MTAFKLCLEYAICEIQEHEKRLELQQAYILIFFVEDVNLLGLRF
jgi:hypothetical protein